jgi:nucleoside-diphosphate-sugar epimerase
MKVLFYGACGWIGAQFAEYLRTHGHIVIDGIARLDHFSELATEIDATEPTHIVSFTGRTHGTYEGTPIPTIDYLEKPGKLVENIRDNLFGPLQLALAAQARKIHYTYMGTGCIFDYDTEHPFEQPVNGFTEQDVPNYFGSSYSIVKGFSDQLMHRLPVLNLRIRMPITGEHNPRNFITKITTYKKVCSIQNSMTVLPTMWPIIADLMTKQVSRTLNLTNPGLISHNDILTMYKELVDPSFSWENFSIEEQAKVLAASRSNNYLDTSVLTMLYPDIPDIHTAVRSILQSYPKP